MPFRYVVDDKTGEPILPEGMREHLKCVFAHSAGPHCALLLNFTRARVALREDSDVGCELTARLCRADMDRSMDDF